MPIDNKTVDPQQMSVAIEAALIRLERAVLDRRPQNIALSGEQASYIDQLEGENRQMARDIAEMKKHCLALKGGYEILAEKYQQLEDINNSAEKELASTLRDLDQLIAQKSLH